MSDTILERASTSKLRKVLERFASQEGGAWYHDHNTYGGWDKVEIHHVIPEAVAIEFKMLFMDINRHSGGVYAFDLNSTDNLLVMPNSSDAQAAAANNGHYAALHLKGDTQHVTYSSELRTKLGAVREIFQAELISGKFSPDQAAARAANRISTVQTESVNGLVGTTQDAVKFYLNNNDRFLIEEYNRKVAANPETGPPIDLGSENTDSLTQAQKQALAQFQQQNYTRIDPDRNLPESINLKNKLASAFDSLANGTVDGPVLILQTALIFEIIREHQIKRGFETFKEAAADYGIDASVEFFRSLVAEEVIDATISAALGPFGLARKIWEVYQSAQGVVSVLELAHARWPENYALSAIVDLIEALSVHSISVDGLDQVLLEIRDGDAGGVIISRELAEKLGPTLSEDKHQLFHFADGTAFYTSNGLAPGQSISLLGPRGFDIIAVLRDNPIVVGVSKSGEKFSIMGQEFLDSYSPYADNSNISKQAVFEAITGYRLFSDSAADGFDQILDQLERAATYDVETNPTILIDRIYADTLKHFGHGHEVFQLSDGQIHRVPGGLEPGEMINLLEGERPGNPHIDPIVSFGLNTDGDQVEITQETHYAIIQIIAELGGDIGEDEALALLTRRATLSEDEIDAELRELLDEPTPGGEAVEATHGLKVPGPTIKSRHAVFSDSDGDGTLDAVTRITTFSDNTQIRQPFKLDPSGELITEERVTLYRVDQALDGEAIGSLFGSQLSNALVGNDLFAEIASGSVLSSVLGNLGEAIDLYFTDNGIDSLFFANQRLGTGEALSFADAVERSIEDFGADVLNNLKSAGISTLSGFLAGELGEALGIDGGFEGQLFQTVSSKTIGTVANTVIDNAIKISNGSAIDLFHNLNASSLLNAGASAVSSFVGGYLAREIVTSDSQAGAIGGSVGGALGSTIGLGLAGVGFFSGLSSSGLGLALGGALSSTILGVSLGAIILPGVGAFLGTILGTVLGDLFDDLFNNNGYPKGTANVSLDFENGLYYQSGTNAANSGGQQLALVTSLAERAEVLVNSYLELMGGENANSHSPTLHFYQVGPGSSSAGLHILVHGPGGESGGAPRHYTRLYPEEITGESVDRNLELAILEAIKAVQIKGGDLYLKRAVLGSEAKDLRAFAGDLQIAEDYKAYLKDKAIIDALIAAEPDSAFAAGWLITLLRAEELGLTTWQESDFYGGLDGLLKSLDVERVYGIAHEDVTVSVITETLDDGSTREDLVLRAGQDADAQIIARINGYEEAVNLNNADATRGWGTTGKDLWFADSEGDLFRDRAGWRQEHSDDILIGGSGDDAIMGGLGWDFIQGGAGNDSLHGGAHEDTVFGGPGDDVITGDDMRIRSSRQADFGTDPESLDGADANDGSTRDWFGFNPQPKGALGHYNTVPERVHFGADELRGGLGDDMLIGAGGSDRIFGGAGNDHLYGGSDGYRIRLYGPVFDGDDYLEGGEGADVINGGHGFDTASYALSVTGVTVDLHLTGAQDSAGDAHGDILINIEDLIGSAHDDTLTGNEGANIIEGGAGNDRIDGADGNDTVSYFSATRAVEVDLSPGTREPGIGIARILGADNDNAIIVFEEDELHSIESVIGTAFEDMIRGSSVAAGTLSGGEGNDTFQIAYDDVAVDGGAVATRVLGGAGFDTLTFANHVPTGTTGVTADLRASATGNQISDVEYVIGSAGADVLITGHTSDYLEGGAGEDRLAGGAGADTYIFKAGGGHDTISDLAGDESNWEAGGARDTVSFGSGIEFRHVTGELTAWRSAALPSEAPADWFATSDLRLGLRDKTDPDQAYETSLSRFTDTLTIEFGGSFETWRNDSHLIEAGAGVVEHLHFSDSGHLDLITVRTFLTGSVDADVLTATSETATSGTWIFSGEGADHLIGGDFGDILVAGVGADIAAGGAGDDQYAYWRGDGHDILRDTGGLDTLVFGGGIGLGDLRLRYGWLEDREDPDSFIEAETPEDQTDLRIEIIDPDDGNTTSGSVTVLDYQDKDRMIERIRASALDEAIDLLKQLDPERFADVDEIVQLQHASSIEVSINHLLNQAIGSANEDVLVAAKGQISLKGYEADDQLLGNDADNILEGGLGADVLDGGLGLDFASYENASSGVDIDLSRTVQNADGDAASEETGDVLTNIEGILGSAFDDTISGNIFENVLNGGAGDDLLYGDGPSFSTELIRGRDTFVFEGVHGNDIVFDFEVGRDALELHQIDAASLRVSVQDNRTVISHSQGSINLENVHWESLLADGASIDVNGTGLAGYGTMVLPQDSGPATHALSPLVGTASGPYTYALAAQAEHGDVTLAETYNGTWSYTYAPTSTGYSGSDSFSLEITSADGQTQIAMVIIDVLPETEQGLLEHIAGSSGHDHLRGGYADDRLSGGDGNDTLIGDGARMDAGTTAGHDVLVGGAGNDILWGDARYLTSEIIRGRDTFVFDGAHGDDTVFDFEIGHDVLELHNIDASTLNVSLNGAHTLITHSLGSVELRDVHWIDLDATELIV